jgi:hypothetical protein
LTSRTIYFFDKASPRVAGIKRPAIFSANGVFGFLAEAMVVYPGLQTESRCGLGLQFSSFYSLDPAAPRTHKRMFSSK